MLHKQFDPALTAMAPSCGMPRSVVWWDRVACNPYSGILNACCLTCNKGHLQGPSLLSLLGFHKGDVSGWLLLHMGSPHSRKKTELSGCLLIWRDSIGRRSSPQMCCFHVSEAMTRAVLSLHAWRKFFRNTFTGLKQYNTNVNCVAWIFCLSPGWSFYWSETGGCFS